MSPQARENYKDMLDSFRKEPDFRASYPKRYLNPEGFLAPDFFFSVMDYSMAKDSVDSKSVTPLNFFIKLLYASMKAHDFPAYFVDEKVLDALAQTDPPKEMSGSDLKDPHPGFLFCLPEKWSLSFFGKLVPFISVCSLNHKDYPEHVSTDNLVSYYFIYKDNGAYSELGWIVPKKEPILASFTKDDLSSVTMGGHPAVSESELADEMLRINSLVKRLCLKLILLMNSKPHLCEDGGIQRAARINHRTGEIEKDALWQPNFIGRNYRVSGSDASGGKSPRMHWRRGHFRAQRHGEYRKLVKVIWIEPMLINAETENEG